MVMLKINLARNLQKKFSQSRAESVKEGYFSVMATNGGNSKWFAVPLNYLNNPAFVRLLEESEEEYGFRHQNILTVPCHPSELERILSGSEMKKQRRISSGVILRAPW